MAKIKMKNSVTVAETFHDLLTAKKAAGLLADNVLAASRQNCYNMKGKIDMEYHKSYFLAVGKARSDAAQRVKEKGCQ